MIKRSSTSLKIGQLGTGPKYSWASVSPTHTHTPYFDPFKDHRDTHPTLPPSHTHTHTHTHPTQRDTRTLLCLHTPHTHPTHRDTHTLLCLHTPHTHPTHRDTHTLLCLLHTHTPTHPTLPPSHTHTHAPTSPPSKITGSQDFPGGPAPGTAGGMS